MKKYYQIVIFIVLQFSFIGDISSKSTPIIIRDNDHFKYIVDSILAKHCILTTADTARLVMRFRISAPLGEITEFNIDGNRNAPKEEKIPCLNIAEHIVGKYSTHYMLQYLKLPDFPYGTYYYRMYTFPLKVKPTFKSKPIFLDQDTANTFSAVNNEGVLFRYKIISDNEVSLLWCDNTMSNGIETCNIDSIVVNSKTKYSVVEIGDSAFAYSTFSKVNIPRSIKSIGSRSFYYSCIRELYLHDSIIDFGIGAFECCIYLSDVYLPKNLKAISEGMFLKCASLKKIDIPSTVKIIENYAFNQCSSLKKIIFPDSIVSVGKFAFMRCIDLEKITLNKNLREIDLGAFAATAVERVIIPNSVTTIKEQAFQNSRVKSIKLPDKLDSISGCCFCHCYRLKKIIIPKSVKYIGNSAFYNCSILKTIKLPEGINTIDDAAFCACESLENITLPNGLEKIGKYAFLGCKNLKNFTLPDSVKFIGENALDFSNEENKDLWR